MSAPVPVWTRGRRAGVTGRARGDWLVNQLPLGMLEDRFLVRFVRIFQTVASTILEQVDNLEHQLDVSVASPEMVRYMGRWLSVDNIDPEMPEELQRQIVVEWGNALPWRGTRRGLETLLALVTAGPVQVEETGGIWRAGEGPRRPPKVVARVASTFWTTEEALLALVRAEVPAAVPFELYVGDERLWPPPDDPDEPDELDELDRSEEPDDPEEGSDDA
jgi:phage tail-like protein